MRRFQVYGLSIASEFDLLLPEDSDAAPPAITITRARPDFFNAFLAKAVPAQRSKVISIRDLSGWIQLPQLE